MRVARSTSGLLAVVFVAVTALGCVERREKLSIAPNGSVHYFVEHKSDSADDLYGGDIVPKPNAGWLVSQEVEKHDDGKQSYRFTAETMIARGGRLPSNFAAPTDGDADLYVQFPTTLKIEKRREGTYYHFARVYSPRPWAAIETLEERIIRAPMAELKSLDVAEWTPAQRQMVARALATFETEKMLLFARNAFRQATPDVAQDGWLAVQGFMRDCLNHLDYKAIAQLLEPREPGADEKARDQEVTAELKGYAELLEDQLKQALFTLAGYNGSQHTKFMVEFDRQKKAFEVTQDLGDDKFEITVEMPGRIIASNAESTEGASVKWSFDGGVVRDREKELLVTSFVSK